MKKLVNGKVIDIENIELFELAAEGLALQNTVVSNTSDGINGDINSELVKNYIKQYDIFFKYMPYPLYAIESDIKYATLGNFIKFLSKTSIEMWVNKGLYIRLNRETGMTLRIVNNTWSIMYTKSVENDNTAMDVYRHEVGYKEYCWVLQKILNKEGTSSFYNQFMGDFVRACNGEPMILKWELENILTFSTVPKKMEFKTNKIINIGTDDEYSLDIYCSGYADTNEEITSWSLGADGPSISAVKKQIKTYGFEAYSKNSKSGANEKMTKCSVNGLHSLFMKLCGVKNARDMQTFPDFEGAIYDSTLAFTINKALFVAKSNRLSEPKEVANGVSLYAIDNGKIYFIKSKKVNDIITKEIIYSYSVKDSAVRLCKIYFRY